MDRGGKSVQNAPSGTGKAAVHTHNCAFPMQMQARLVVFHLR
jgi:hypothetical protein